MSFRVNYSDTILANRALSRLPEAPIPNLDFASHAARTCKLWYKPVVRAMLEAHDWSLAQKREALSESETNLHPGYLYAYQEPADLAFLVGVEYAADTGRGLVQGVSQRAQRFERMGGLIYSNVADAVAVYTSLDITEDDFTEQFAMAVDLHLAARIAVPITKKQDLEDKLLRAANAYVNTAIANYRNQQGVTYGNEYSETDAARQNGFGYSGPGNYPLGSAYPSNGGF